MTSSLPHNVISRRRRRRYHGSRKTKGSSTLRTKQSKKAGAYLCEVRFVRVKHYDLGAYGGGTEGRKTMRRIEAAIATIKSDRMRIQKMVNRNHIQYRVFLKNEDDLVFLMVLDPHIVEKCYLLVP